MAIIKKKVATDGKPKVVRAKKVPTPVVPPPYVSAFSVGNRVTHHSFGGGEVIEVTNDKLSIRFDDDTTKLIVDAFAKHSKA